MNNVIKYLIYLLVALLLVSWLITVGQSCSQETKPTPDATSVAVDRADSARDLMNALENEDTADFSQELESILDEEEAINEASEEDAKIDYTSYEPEEEVKPTPKPKPAAKATTSSKPPSSKPAASASGPGTFLVVAGSYLHPDNANKQRDKLAQLGYDSEVVSFELSEYHSVLAGRYDDYNRAELTVKNLSRDGVDAYVKRRSR